MMIELLLPGEKRAWFDGEMWTAEPPWDPDLFDTLPSAVSATVLNWEYWRAKEVAEALGGTVVTPPPDEEEESAYDVVGGTSDGDE